MKRIGKNTLEFEMPPTILGHAAIGGKKEAEGPLGADYDQTFQDTTLNTESWEKAEAQLQKEAVALALEKSGFTAGQMDVIFAGDLLNQCISSTFGLLDFQIPFLGQYGACSTMAQTLLLSAVMVESERRNVPWRLPALISALRNASSERPWSMEPSVRLRLNGRPLLPDAP